MSMKIIIFCQKQQICPDFSVRIAFFAFLSQDAIRVKFSQ